MKYYIAINSIRERKKQTLVSFVKSLIDHISTLKIEISTSQCDLFQRRIWNPSGHYSLPVSNELRENKLRIFCLLYSSRKPWKPNMYCATVIYRTNGFGDLMLQRESNIWKAERMNHNLFCQIEPTPAHRDTHEHNRKVEIFPMGATCT